MKLRYRRNDYFNLNHTAIGSDFFTWIKLLSRNRFRVQLPFVPKALFVTGATLFNAPVQLVERAIFSRRIREAKIVKPVFILGHPRSGTTFLQYLLSRDPNFAYCSAYEGLVPHIFLTGGSALQRLMQSVMPSTRPQDNVRISTSLPVEEEFAMASISDSSWVHGLYFPESLDTNFQDTVVFSGPDKFLVNWRKNFLYFLKKIAFRYPGKTLLLKSPTNTGRVKEILALFPDARFIHIHRDPYEVFQSNERLYEKILPLLGFHRADDSRMTEYIFSFYRNIYTKYLHDKITVPENQIIEIGYADFVKNPLHFLERAYRQLSLDGFNEAKPYFEKEIQDVRGYEKNRYEDIDMDTVQRINVEWKFAFDAFGYPMR